MDTEERLPVPNGVSPFARIRRTNAAGAEYWSSRDFAQVLGYSDYRNFEQVVRRAKTACFNSGQRVEDHFGEITEMVQRLSSGSRPELTFNTERVAGAQVCNTGLTYSPAQHGMSFARRAQGSQAFAIECAALSRRYRRGTCCSVT